MTKIVMRTAMTLAAVLVMWVFLLVALTFAWWLLHDRWAIPVHPTERPHQAPWK